ncbi:MAG TPA: PEP-CTERM sorting domain-containing protein [Pirellulaceae bacterium]|nr:PEP-CTERM sorting domain-containing protein [Pirellulaceae bacterium]HMO92322.1 PEP-CTERM sorting domain-containing protein [Pirellulaceae bacterium]HMP69246.1 PEP-CTERM sorting domain-containing protein [Pirellulaceae bacterium]
MDGILRDTKTYSAFGLSNANFAIGGVLNAAGNQMVGSFNGFVDEVSLWSRALNDADVAYLYNNPGALVIPEPSSFLLIGAVAMLCGFRPARKSL